MKRMILTLFWGLIFTALSIHAQTGKDTFTYKIGTTEITLLSEGQQNGRTGILIGVTPEILAKTAPDGTFPNATNAFLVRTLQFTILVDTGHGRKLFDNLESIGVKPEDIDIVLITHMHGDHIGGMLQNDLPVFSQAIVYISKPEHDYWMSDIAMNSLPENRRGGFAGPRKVIEAYGENVKLFTPGDTSNGGNDLLLGIRSIAAYGHTPGHTAFLVESVGQQLLIWGDLTHAMAVQMPYPDIAVTYDVDPDMAIISRKEVLRFVIEQNIPVAGMHITYPAIGKISSNGEGGYNYAPMQ